jgi:hypothetical protein
MLQNLKIRMKLSILALVTLLALSISELWKLFS